VFELRFILKLLISVCIIVVCGRVGGKLPSLAGLITVMPLTSLIVLIWLYSDNPGDFELMRRYTKGALLGIVPTILFFVSAFICFRRQFPIWAVLSISFLIWLAGAALHLWFLKGGLRFTD